MLEYLSTEAFACYTLVRNKFLEDFAEYRDMRYEAALKELNIAPQDEENIICSFAANCYGWLIARGLEMLSAAGINNWTKNRVLEYFPTKNSSFAKVIDQYSERNGAEDIDWLGWLYNTLLSDAENLEMFFFAIIADESSIQMPPMNKKRARALLENSRHVESLKECTDILFKSIEQYPYNVDTWRQLIAASGPLVFNNETIILLCGLWLPDCRIQQNIIGELAESLAYILDDMPGDTNEELRSKIDYLYAVLHRFKVWSKEHKVARYFIETYEQVFVDIAKDYISELY